MHVPIAWSDVRPTDEEFAAALVSTRLRAHRLVAFVRQRRAAVRRLALVNSEGYWDGEACGWWVAVCRSLSAAAQGGL